jgi:heme exporter protein D
MIWVWAEVASLVACILVLVVAVLLKTEEKLHKLRKERDELASQQAAESELAKENAELQEMLMLYTRHVFQVDINRMVNGSLSYVDGEWKQGEVGSTWTIPTDAQSLTLALQEKAQWQSTQTMSR